MASAGEFSSIPVTRRRYPDNEQRIATHSYPRDLAVEDDAVEDDEPHINLSARERISVLMPAYDQVVLNRLDTGDLFCS